MSEILITDVLVVGEGCAGQTAALAASEEGCDVALLGDGRPPSTAWLKKQVVRVVDGTPHFADAPL
jgi:succinate dehydrogenase/fumarate reductase flavoprotein subunit